MGRDGSDWDFINSHMGGHDEDGLPNFMRQSGFADDSDCEEDRDELTYDEWQEHGRQVKHGEKSHRKNGKAVFYFSQTKSNNAISNGGEDWDDDDEFTYDEWQEHGYQVMRGEKSHRKNGKIVFYFSQTMPK
ncbi:MAG: hypothetical protein GX029_12865 [Pseudomonadaceae bacterium]|nr:hypothetical protein [Pseudomonadaceae bacterium]